MSPRVFNRPTPSYLENTNLVVKVPPRVLQSNELDAAALLHAMLNDTWKCLEQ